MNKMENTIDYKLGQISSDIQSLRDAHAADKTTRDENHKKIEQISNDMAEWKRVFMHLDSWKNGQQEFMHVTTTNVQGLEKKLEIFKDLTNGRLKPLEIDLEKRQDDANDTGQRRRDLWYDIGKYLAVALLGAILVNLPTIWHTLINNL